MITSIFGLTILIAIPIIVLVITVLRARSALFSFSSYHLNTETDNKAKQDKKIVMRKFQRYLVFTPIVLYVSLCILFIIIFNELNKQIIIGFSEARLWLIIILGLLAVQLVFAYILNAYYKILFSKASIQLIMDYKSFRLVLLPIIISVFLWFIISNSNSLSYYLSTSVKSTNQFTVDQEVKMNIVSQNITTLLITSALSPISCMYLLQQQHISNKLKAPSSSD